MLSEFETEWGVKYRLAEGPPVVLLLSSLSVDFRNRQSRHSRRLSKEAGSVLRAIEKTGIEDADDGSQSSTQRLTRKTCSLVVVLFESTKHA